MTTIYVTKYALSAGIIIKDAELSEEGKRAMWKTEYSYDFAYRNEFWLTPEEALADCERRRQNKLKSIEKQKTKLEKMQFTIPE